MNNRSCAVIAEPPLCFPWGFDEEDERCIKLKLVLISQLSFLQAENVTRFYVPIDAGFGMYVSESIISLMDSDQRLKLYTLIPYENQAAKWSPELRDRYYAVLEKCSESLPVSIEYSSVCVLDSLLEAIDQAELILAICSEEKPQDKAFATALRYAQRNGKAVRIVTSPVQ